MAFGRSITANIGVGATVVSAAVPAAKTHTVHGLSIANKSANPANATVTMTDGTATVNVVQSVTIPAGDTLGVMGMEFKHNLITGDSISVASSTATSLDVMYSYLEQ